MISQKAKYALKALVALARAPQGAAVQMRDIAAGENIPHKFLEQIMLDMKRAGYVASRRGRSGGYELLKPASAITFGEVLRLIDGPIAPLPCLSRIAYRRCEDCVVETECEIRRVFANVAQATRQVLDSTTIEDSLTGDAPPLSLETAP
jgi:Rrf2 family protein